MSDLFIGNSQMADRGRRNTATDLRVPKTVGLLDRRAFHTEVLKSGIVSQLNTRKHHHYANLNIFPMILNF